MSLYTIKEETLTAIGDAIREKNGSTETYNSSEMAAAIRAIESGGGSGEITLTGDCSYALRNQNWNNVMDSITTKDITKCSNMFHNNKEITEVPFAINCLNDTQINCSNMFAECEKLTSIPYFTNCCVSNFNKMFYNCYSLREVPEDMVDRFNWKFADGNSDVKVDKSAIFQGCRSLRSAPMDFITKHNAIISGAGYSYFRYCFDGCSCLDEVIGFYIPKYVVYEVSSNLFSNTFSNCFRLKNLTFDAGTTYYKMGNQTIDLSNYVGYCRSSYDSFITGWNSGITDATKITDDATYQALKDNPDSWTMDINYSRYNHDSAVATINSLPNTSLYVSDNGGTNTIKFKGASGAKTDGGAINTLTETEIAVATAKGWTVSLV